MAQPTLAINHSSSLDKLIQGARESITKAEEKMRILGGNWHYESAYKRACQEKDYAEMRLIALEGIRDGLSCLSSSADQEVLPEKQYYNPKEPFIALDPALRVVASGMTKDQAKMKARAAGCSTPIIARKN